MKHIAELLAAALALNGAASLSAHALQGDYNTGPSVVKETEGASMNVRFHPCADDQSLFCATVLEALPPPGVPSKTNLPDGSLIVGYQFITGLKMKAPGKYRGGKILAIDESIVEDKMNWYGVKIDKNEDGSLTATGCLGFICPRKMIWPQIEDAADRAAP